MKFMYWKMSFFEKNSTSVSSTEKSSVSELIYSMITGDQLSSSYATPDEEETSSGASTTNEDAPTPTSIPTDDTMTISNSLNDFTSIKNDSLTISNQSPSKSRRMANSASNASQLLPNGKKTKGRVKIKMEFIDNKLRRYTTFSKRKTGIMKKAYELSTLTGTQVMLLVASETGHVYTFATKKLQPMITSDAGKALIQTCLNSTESADGPPHFGESSAISANFHTSEIANLTPASLLFASNTTSANLSNGNQAQQRQTSTNNQSSKKSPKLNQQHSSNAIQNVLQQAAAGVMTSENGNIEDLSIFKDLGIPNVKGSSKASYYNANELPTMVAPSSSSRFSMDGSGPIFLTQSTAGDDDLETDSTSDTKHDNSEIKNMDTVKVVNGNAKRKACFQKHSTTSSSNSAPSTNSIPAGSTLNNILHNIVANRQQQKQSASSSLQTNSHNASGQSQQVNRRKRPPTSNASQSTSNKQANIFGQTTASTNSQSSNANANSSQQLGSQLFPFAGLIPGSTNTSGTTTGNTNNQAVPFGLFPGLGNGAFIYPPGIVYTPTPVSLPEGAAAALALQQMLASVVAASNNSNLDGQRLGQQQSQHSTTGNAAAVQAAQQSLIPLSLPLSMMTANYLASRQSQMDEFEDGNQLPLDDEESD